MIRRTIRASWCITTLALGMLAGCAAQTDGTADTDEAWTENPRPGTGGSNGETCGGPVCASHLKEDPAMACYRRVTAPVLDSQGGVHNESLYVQLGLAAGIQYAQLQTVGTNTCSSPSYDCSGVFYDGSRVAMRVAGPPPTVRTDADVAHWKAGVIAFYDGAYTDALAHSKLSPGKAQLCTTWAEIRFQTHPDPSILQAFVMLQKIGAESAVHQDRTWMKNILAAGNARGCMTPALPPDHDEESWFVPMDSARAFHAAFRDCNQPDTSRVGGCPHSFDAPKGLGNFVNDQHILDAFSCGAQAAWIVGDPTGGCGASCYVRKTL